MKIIVFLSNVYMFLYIFICFMFFELLSSKILDANSEKLKQMSCIFVLFMYNKTS